MGHIVITQLNIKPNMRTYSNSISLYSIHRVLLDIDNGRTDQLSLAFVYFAYYLYLKCGVYFFLFIDFEAPFNIQKRRFYIFNKGKVPLLFSDLDGERNIKTEVGNEANKFEMNLKHLII